MNQTTQVSWFALVDTSYPCNRELPIDIEVCTTAAALLNADPPTKRSLRLSTKVKEQQKCVEARSQAATAEYNSLLAEVGRLRSGLNHAQSETKRSQDVAAKSEKEAQKLRKAKAKAQDSEKKLRVQVSQMQTKTSTSPKTSPSNSNSKSKTDEEIAKLRGSVQILEESVSVSFASKVDDVVQNTSLLLDEQLQQTQRLWETSSAILKSDIEVQFMNHSTKAQDLARQTFTAAISDMCAQSDKHFEAERKFHALMATTNENHSTKILKMQEAHLNQCMADLKRSQESELFSKLSAEIHRANAIRDKTHAAAAAPPPPRFKQNTKQSSRGNSTRTS